MLRYRKVYFDLNLKILTIIITQVFCKCSQTCQINSGVSKRQKNRFVTNNFIANDSCLFPEEN